MATTGKPGKRDTGTRDKLLDATVAIMLEQGYAAATSRRVAERVGVQRAVVYYYFPTMDDLYLAVLRRGAQHSLDAQRAALASGEPLHALWDMTVNPIGSRLTMELMALGNHRPEIRAELAASAERFREAQVAALTHMLRHRTGDGGALPPEVVSVLIASIGRLIAIEAGLGITTGHDRTLEIVGDYLDRFESAPAQTTPDAS